MDFNLVEMLARLGIFFVPFLFALCFHEFAHGWVAKRRGDNTAEMMGRLTMNPMAHADPLGTFALPILSIAFSSPVFFGWAKPVPVSERNLKNPRSDMFWVALAGPASNILLALVATLLLAFYYAFANSLGLGSVYRELLQSFLVINLFLAAFNLIPIHPLDGGKIIEPFIPASANAWLEQNQMTLSMFLMAFILLGGGFLSGPVLMAANLLQGLALTLAGVL